MALPQENRGSVIVADGVRKDEEFSGTKPVEERHRIDETRLDGWMRDHVEGYQGPLTVLQFKGGQSNPTYRLDTPGRSYVMRRRPFGKLLPSAHAVDREFRVIAALEQAGLSGREGLCAVHRRRGDRLGLLHHVDGRGPGVLGSHAAEPDAGSAAHDLHQQDRDAGETAHLRSAGDRARRFRQARQLFRAPGRSLDQAIPRVRDPAHSRIREADRVAADEPCRSRSGSRSFTATIASTT